MLITATTNIPPRPARRGTTLAGAAGLLLVLGTCAALSAGPKEFGLAELNRAIAERKLPPRQASFRTEFSSSGAETFRIQPGLISAGDLRGLMYGLLEAAAQIREKGRVTSTKGAPATRVRGIRFFLHNEDLESEWYYSRDYWTEYFRMLARNRFNRFNLVFAHQTPYLAPPYPFWVELPEFPGIRVPGLSPQQRRRNLDMLRFISQTAADHAIDFTLGVWQHNVQPRMKPSVEGLTRENIGPYSYAALKKVLAECPAIRSVQMRTNFESGIAPDQQVEFYRDWAWRAIREAGRRVTLDLRGWVMQKGMLEAAVHSGVPLRLSSKYWCEDLGRPYPPAETWPNYSYINFLEWTGEGRRPYEFLFELWGLGSHRLLLWGDPAYVRRAVPTFSMSGAAGFEIDPPLAQKGFGNRPGKWGVFTPGQRNRVFWNHEFERYWLFYLLWGRLSYDPSAEDSVWMAELRRRFGAAAADVMDAYRHSSRVLNEIVAAHLADPNMYIWPEINPGGLIDAYREVRPSDWRFIATIPEAVRNRVSGTASAKQTPLQTANLLHDAALAVERAVERAKAKLGDAHKEWLGSEPDFQVLAALARYHGRKQMAADQLEYYYQTGDSSGLDAAHRELRGALAVWERLVKLTDGLYPEEMAFGPDDIGHWKHKLPYVRHDVETVAQRRRIHDAVGRFDFGFDFGGPPRERSGGLYRNDPFVLAHTVEPRFRGVHSKTAYSEETGYGWAGEGEREDVAAPVTPYLEIRAAARDPKQLPANALFGDSIRGRGPQTFRVRTGEGRFQVRMLAGGKAAEPVAMDAAGGVLDIVMPEGKWTVAGLVIRKLEEPREAPPRTWPKQLPRPAFTHVPPKAAPAGRPVTLSLRVSPLKDATAVRLHYRAVNQLAKFRTLEAPAAKAVFTIPAEHLDPRWDLMYYFEVLNREGLGWFEPDPAAATPYHVVPAAAPDSQGRTEKR